MNKIAFPLLFLVAMASTPALVAAHRGTPAEAKGRCSKKLWEVASSRGEGAVRYRWVNPVTHVLERKVTFFAKAGNDACGVGAYNPQ